MFCCSYYRARLSSKRSNKMLEKLASITMLAARDRQSLICGSKQHFYNYLGFFLLAMKVLDFVLEVRISRIK